MGTSVSAATRTDSIASQPSPVDPLYSQQIVFEGISVGASDSMQILKICSLTLLWVDLHGDGKQHSMDATVAYKQAALNCMAYLKKLGYTREQ